MNLRYHINKTSTTQQDPYSQPLPLILLSESEPYLTTIMAAPKKETPRFESLPPEIRNMIYKHLFPPAALCKVRRIRQFMPHWDPQRQYVYIFHTAILRSNRLIGQEAKSVLYGSDVLVHISWDMQARDYHIVNCMPPKVAFNRIPKGNPPPPCVVQIYHRVQHSKRRRVSIIVAAVDLHVICALILRRCSCRGCQPRASYSLAALPQPGWPRQRLLELIWLPLKTLGRHGYYGSVKVEDSTGVFEQAHNMSDWEEESKQGSNTEPDRSSDTEEDESDENDSEDDESDELDSNDGEVEEDENESTGCAQASSDEDDCGEDNSDENVKAQDKSDEAAPNNHPSNDPSAKPSNGPASNPIATETRTRKPSRKTTPVPNPATSRPATTSLTATSTERPKSGIPTRTDPNQTSAMVLLVVPSAPPPTQRRSSVPVAQTMG